MAKKKKNKVTKKSQPKIAVQAVEKKGFIEQYGIFFLLIATKLLFAQAYFYDFVNWDDPNNLTENPYVQRLNLENIYNIFTTDVIGNYNPLSILSFAIEHAIFGLDPRVYHGNNILLHLLTVYFVYRVCILLKLSWKGSLLCAALFAVHPMRVESVVWITERKDVLLGVFFFSSMLNYVKWKATGLKKYIYYCFLLFFIGLFAKIQMVSLPLALLCADFYMDGKMTLKNIINKAPFLTASFITGVIGILVLSDQGSLEDVTNYGGLDRIAIGGYSLVVYLFKLFFPHPLLPLYAYPAEIPAHIYYLSPLAIIFIGSIAWAFIKKWKLWFFGAGFFFVNVMFLLQIKNAGQGFLAYRFTYIAYFGLFFMISYLADHLMTRPKYRTIIPLASIAVLTALSAKTFNQTKIWENGGTLWSHVLKYNTKAVTPFTNRAQYYRDNNQTALALADFQRAIEMKPDRPASYNSLAKLYFSYQEFQKAVDTYAQGLKYDPTNAEMLVNRGAGLGALSRYAEGIQSVTKGLQSNPDNLNGYLNRSIMYQNTAQYKLAYKDIVSYLQRNNQNADLWYERAVLERRFNQLDQATQSINNALALNRNRGLYYYEFSILAAKKGDKATARTYLQQAKQLGGVNVDPNFENSLR